jgi:hypothetical protein
MTIPSSRFLASRRCRLRRGAPGAAALPVEPAGGPSAPLRLLRICRRRTERPRSDGRPRERGGGRDRAGDAVSFRLFVPSASRRARAPSNLRRTFSSAEIFSRRDPRETCERSNTGPTSTGTSRASAILVLALAAERVRRRRHVHGPSRKDASKGRACPGVRRRGDCAHVCRLTRIARTRSQGFVTGTPTAAARSPITPTGSPSTSTLALNSCCGCVKPWNEAPACKRPAKTEYDRMAMPECWVHAFERYGFYWLGHDVLRDTMHFEFLGDPDKIRRNAPDVAPDSVSPDGGTDRRGRR